MKSRDQAWREAGGLCCYCGCLTHNPDRERGKEFCERLGVIPHSRGSKKLRCYMTATREHLIRKVEGGSDAAGNLALACHYCNSVRQNATVEDHRYEMLALVAAGLHPCHRPPKIAEAA